MKKIMIQMTKMLMMVACLSLSFVACSDDDDNRAYEGATIVGVKVNGTLFTPSETTTAETKVPVNAGTDLSNAKLQVLVANGQLVNFENGTEFDCRKPLAVTLQGYDGKTVETKLRIVSAPKLQSFIIKGLTIPSSDIHESSTAIIVQVPEDTDLTALEVTMEFANGTLQNFTNGVEKDYTEAHTFSLLGTDEETVYPYELMITTETVGPASITAMEVNGILTDSVVVKEGNVVVPYVPSLMDFTSVNVELVTGYGNKVDEAFTGTGLNLLSGANKVTVTGTNGIPTEFTIGVPQLSFKPIIEKTTGEMNIGGNGLGAVGFSGNYVLTTDNTTAQTPAYFDLATGERVGNLTTSGVSTAGYGFRKFATDDKGAVLALSLGMGSGEQWIYKYDSATDDAGETYISFSKASLGVDYAPRSAGINICGSLDGNATIIMPIAQKQDVFVWKVTNGVLNPTPQHYTFPYSGASYYWSVIAMPDSDNFLGFVTNNSLENAGVVGLSKTMSETFRYSGFYATDGKVIKYNGRTYLAYTAHNNNKATMCLCDITDGQLTSYQNPIFKKVMKVEGGNGNATMDADFTVIDGKLHVAFSCTNIALYVYAFDK
ncbi:MAG: hypothetical protein IJ494_07055 [Bacteroides sp.]|nr:hypothetical protein [Bacteroides sp.]